MVLDQDEDVYYDHVANKYTILLTAHSASMPCSVLSTGKQIGMASLQQKLKTMKVPDLSGTEKVPPIGKVKYSLTG